MDFMYFLWLMVSLSSTDMNINHYWQDMSFAQPICCVDKAVQHTDHRLNSTWATVLTNLQKEDKKSLSSVALACISNWFCWRVHLASSCQCAHACTWLSGEHKCHAYQHLLLPLPSMPSRTLLVATVQPHCLIHLHPTSATSSLNNSIHNTHTI